MKPLDDVPCGWAPMADTLYRAYHDTEWGVPERDSRALWEKFVFLASFSGITSAARVPIGVVRADPDLRATLEAAMREVSAVGRARGVVLPDDFVAKQLAFADGLPAAMRSSMLNDLESGFRREVPWLSGAVARMARESGLEAPVHATLHAILKPYAGGRSA